MMPNGILITSTVYATSLLTSVATLLSASVAARIRRATEETPHLAYHDNTNNHGYNGHCPLLSAHTTQAIVLCGRLSRQ